MKKIITILLTIVVVGSVILGIYKLFNSEDTVKVNVKVTEAEYSGEADFSDVKNELQKNNTKLEIGNEEENDAYGSLYIKNSNVILDVYYPSFINDEKQEHTKFVVNNISNPISIYIEGELGGEDSYPVEFYVMDKDSNIYVVYFLVRDYDNESARIYKVK